MSISYFIQTTVLVEPTREVFINMFEKALKLDAKLEASPEILAEKMMVQLSKPDKYGHLIAEASCAFTLRDGIALLELYCGFTTSGMLSILFAIKSRKIYCDEDEDGYGTDVDFNWYLKKILFMTESCEIGYLEARSDHAEPVPFKEWTIWGHLSGKHSFLRELEQNSEIRTMQGRTEIADECGKILVRLRRKGYDYKDIDIDQISEHDKSIGFIAMKENLQVHVEIKNFHIYLKSLNDAKPRNIRPHIELLYAICEDYCIYWYFAYNGKSEDVSL